MKTSIEELGKKIDYILNDKLFNEYKQSLKAKSDSRTRYYASPDGWKEYKESALARILGETK